MATTYDEILTLFRSVAEMQREVAEAQREATRAQQEATRAQQEEAKARQEDAARAQQEEVQARRELAEAQKATDLQIKATDLQVKETSREIAELKSLFTSQWGKLMESLVEGDLVNLLRARGIAITDTSTRLKRQLADGGHCEFDILAHSGEELVVVEVKTTLRPKDVKAFLRKLDLFKQWLPRDANNRIFGAMAWLSADAGADGNPGRTTKTPSRMKFGAAVG